MKQIAAKLVKVMADCAYIQKGGTNDFLDINMPRQPMCWKK